MSGSIVGEGSGADAFWREIFQPASGEARQREVRLRILKKGGRPFLFLPRNAKAARATLGLYPAQTGRANAATLLAVDG